MPCDATFILIEPANPKPETPCQILVVVNPPPQIASSHLPLSQTPVVKMLGLNETDPNWL